MLLRREYEILHQYKTGGRTDCKRTKIKNEKIYSLDVCSLYPFIMMAYN